MDQIIEHDIAILCADADDDALERAADMTCCTNKSAPSKADADNAC